MIKSMTGYGKRTFENESFKLSIEVRCLNSRQFDFNFRSSGILKEKEIEIRSLVAKTLERGKVELTLFYENLEEPALARLNKMAIEKYTEEFRKLGDMTLDIDNATLLSLIMRLPDVLVPEKSALKDGEWQTIRQNLTEVLDETDAFRVQEGKAMQKDIEKRVQLIRSYIDRLTPFEKERTGKIHDRIREKFREINDPLEVDENRFEQELIYYLEKLDVTEEKVRLGNHIDYFMGTLNQNQAVGKKLGFISQEMGREINTLGSKANHAEIQKIIVQMKDELEKIKEQLLNIL